MTCPGGNPPGGGSFPSLNRTPHALHSVFGPSGPFLHSGVFCVRQLKHTFPAHGARSPSPLGSGGGFAAAALASFACCCCCCCCSYCCCAIATNGSATGDATRALSSFSDGTFVIGRGGTPSIARPRLRSICTSTSDGTWWFDSGRACSPYRASFAGAFMACCGRTRPGCATACGAWCALGAWLGCGAVSAALFALAISLKSTAPMALR
mmetsp:Transcript_7823/g.28569  ORF Transcript_7823/g.28569 Transcript_7823/m.28569 type:complete len:209 (-) Transcript_7823:404-1030(-)